MDNKIIGFIGAGNMAYAIANGMVTSGLIKASNIITSARTTNRLNTVWKDLGTKTTLSNTEVVQTADVIFLSVKPHILPGVLDEIQGYTDSSKLFASVAAGVTIDFMESKLISERRQNIKIIRTMPNTPCLVRSGVVLLSCNSHCTEEEKNMMKSLLEVTGLVEEVQEPQIDAMTSVTGCGIAWFYMMIEGLSDGAVKNGVPRDQSYRLAAKAVEGAAKMVLETGKHPGQLKDEVTSPGGSTICGVYELEQSGMRGIFMKAIDAATKRNKELGKQ